MFLAYPDKVIMQNNGIKDAYSQLEEKLFSFSYRAEVAKTQTQALIQMTELQCKLNGQSRRVSVVRVRILNEMNRILQIWIEMFERNLKGFPLNF